MWSFLRAVDLKALSGIGEKFTGKKSIRAKEVLQNITSLKFLDKYTGFSMLRCICEVVDVRLRSAAEDAGNMSLNASLLAEVLPFASARQKLHSFLGFPPPDSILSYMYCETIKVLREESVLVALKQYEDKPELFAKDLSDPRTKALIDRMAAMQAEADTDSAETALVKRMFPATASYHHNTASTLKRWRSRSCSCEDT